jgi:hypothetical protein
MALEQGFTETYRTVFPFQSKSTFSVVRDIVVFTRFQQQFAGYDVDRAKDGKRAMHMFHQYRKILASILFDQDNLTEIGSWIDQKQKRWS